MTEGRPSDYTLEMAETICRELAEGRSMVELTMRPNMPAQSTVYLWLEKHPEFSEMYTRARERQAHTIADRAAHMALHGAADPQSAAVQLNAIKWMAARLAPKHYGDKLDLNHGGQGKENPQRLVIGWDDD
jgi:hypothetical protein